METFLGSIETEEMRPLIHDLHYSKRMPGIHVGNFALWTPGGLWGPVAVATFSIPPSRWSEPVVEMTRLVWRENIVSQLPELVKFGCEQMKELGHFLIIAYADQGQNERGIIYQFSDFQYNGLRKPRMDGLLINDIFVPGRSCNSQWNTQSPERLRKILPTCKIEPHYDKGKHLYWLATTSEGKSRASRLGLRSLKFPAITKEIVS